MNAGVPRSVTLADVLADPRWFLAALDGARNAFQFVHTDHETLAAQAFLDRRWDREALPRCDVPIDELLARAPAALPPTPEHFLWHTGFCCSTLIARLLDRPGRNLSLSEPQVFTTLADAKRAGALPNRDTTMRACQVVLHLLGRPLERGANVTIKPAPASCCFLGEAKELTSGKMLFLYSDCRSFVVSAVKKGEEGRGYVRRMLQALTLDGHKPAGIDLAGLNDLEAAAMLWHMQAAAFRDDAVSLGDRAASLDCDAFLAAPQEALASIDRFLALDLGGAHITQVLDGPLFRRHSKSAGEAFDARRRREEHEDTRRELGDTLEAAIARSTEIFSGTPVGTPLPNPLLTIWKPA